MKRQNILLVLLLLLHIVICCGCSTADPADSVKEKPPSRQEEMSVENSEHSYGSSEVSSESAEASEEASDRSNPSEESVDPSESAKEPSEAPILQEAAPEDKALNENTEDVTGIFEGLEGNYTAVFSFDGIETAFYFKDPAVQEILFEAVAGSAYTLSYYFDSETGLDTIYKISE